MMSKSNTVVNVQHISKSFRIPLEGSTGLKQKLVNHLKGRNGYRDFTPLRDVSFTIEKGDFFGIVGRNGSGKSTLLKTLAGIYTPNEGSIDINGSVVPFIELGVGFNPELTGRENVFLNGALLGFSRSEMYAMYDEIVQFAELHDFMDERLKNYSSGMQVRLAFSIAIRADGDILLLDEVLAVGDEAFQQKCYDYFSSLKLNKKTVILVTHDMSAVEKYCNKAILIENGKVKKSGTNIDIANSYKQLFIDERVSNKSKKTEIIKDSRKISVKSATVSQSNVEVKKVTALKPFTIKIEFTSKNHLGPAAFGLNIINSSGIIVYAIGTGALHDDPYEIKEGDNNISVSIDENIFTNDRYSINIAIAEGEQNSHQRLIYQQVGVLNFSIVGIKSRVHSLVHLKSTIKAE